MTKASDQQPVDTKAQMLDAALQALRTEGFAGATSRAIARIGGFNQALIFYHYGSLDALLLAALDASSEARLARYREALEHASSLAELIELAAAIFREDRESGHTTVVAQMIAGSLARPELVPELAERMQLWVDFCEEAIGKALARSPHGALVPVRDLAYAVVTLSLGANLATHLDAGGKRTESVFQQALAFARLVDS